MPDIVIRPIVDLIGTGTPTEQVSALDALLNLPLSDDEVAVVSSALDAALARPTNPRLVRKAADAPLENVRARLRELAGGEGEVARAASIGLAENGDSSAAGVLLRQLAASGGDDVEAAAALARLPAGTVAADAEALRQAASSDDADARFWAAVALAKAGDDSALRQIMATPGRDADAPSLLWGNPWAAHEEIATAAPVPQPVHDWLADVLSSEAELAQYQWLTAGALTGLMDAEGRPHDWAD